MGVLCFTLWLYPHPCNRTAASWGRNWFEILNTNTFVNWLSWFLTLFAACPWCWQRRRQSNRKLFQQQQSLGPWKCLFLCWNCHHHHRYRFACCFLPCRPSWGMALTPHLVLLDFMAAWGSKEPYETPPSLRSSFSSFNKRQSRMKNFFGNERLGDFSFKGPHEMARVENQNMNSSFELTWLGWAQIPFKKIMLFIKIL